MQRYTLAELENIEKVSTGVTDKDISRVKSQLRKGKTTFRTKYPNKLACIIARVMFLIECENEVIEIAKEAAKRYLEAWNDPYPQENYWSCDEWLKLVREEPLKRFINSDNTWSYEGVFESALEEEVRKLYYA